MQKRVLRKYLLRRPISIDWRP